MCSLRAILHEDQIVRLDVGILAGDFHRLNPLQLLQERSCPLYPYYQSPYCLTLSSLIHPNIFFNTTVLGLVYHLPALDCEESSSPFPGKKLP